MPDKIQRTTASGVPNWISDAVGPIRTVPGNDPRALAYVDPSQANPTINVVRPNLYTPAIAAHEATHLFQNTRNQAFQNNMRALAPVAGDRSAYNYGGVPGIQAHPMKSIGQYNHEQQAQMVQDLTQAQQGLRPNMTPARLQQWDTTKTTLERPIRQLQMIPGPDTTVASRGDNWLNNHGIAGNPLQTLSSLISPPSMNTQPQPVPSAPSVALGYANPSKLVR